MSHSFFPQAPDAAGVISWVHLGDLHMTRAGEQNHRDLQAIVQEINAAFAGSVSFVYLPGDVVDDGSATGYAVVRKELDALTVPWCAILGDHDVHEKSFENFLDAMADEKHYAFTVGGVRFVAMNAFDVAHPASFTVSAEQVAWVEKELAEAAAQGMTKVLLLHCYPSDLKKGGDEVSALVKRYSVRLVDMGHTHYNEIANDGGTIYTATRSTGQVEEGPVGFSITNLDGGALSWRFAELGELPFVMITSPEDTRLRTGAMEPPAGAVRVRAKIWGKAEMVAVHLLAEGHTLPMERVGDSRVWETTLVLERDRDFLLRVEATDADGKTAWDEIRLDRAQHNGKRPARDQDNALGAWPEHGVLGTQLGPNKNGKKW